MRGKADDELGKGEKNKGLDNTKKPREKGVLKLGRFVEDRILERSGIKEERRKGPGGVSARTSY